MGTVYSRRKFIVMTTAAGAGAYLVTSPLNTFGRMPFTRKFLKDKNHRFFYFPDDGNNVFIYTKKYQEDEFIIENAFADTSSYDFLIVFYKGKFSFENETFFEDRLRQKKIIWVSFNSLQNGNVQEIQFKQTEGASNNALNSINISFGTNAANSDYNFIINNKEGIPIKPEYNRELNSLSLSSIIPDAFSVFTHQAKAYFNTLEILFDDSGITADGTKTSGDK